MPILVFSVCNESMYAERWIANANDGTLTVGSLANDGALTVAGGNFSAASITNSGTIEFTGGTLGVSGVFNNNANAMFVAAENRVCSLGGAIMNAGEILLGGGAAAVNGGAAIANTGLIRGDGRITASVVNASGGEIRAEAGKRLKLDGALGTNHGLISLQGGTAEFAQALTNNSTGVIMGRGTLMVGGAGLANNGNIALSGGFTDIYGDVANNSGAKIVVSGGATATFYDDVVNDGTLFRVSQGCAAVFFGGLSGGGSFSGTGTVYIEGDLRPGHSPGEVSFEGDLVLGRGATLVAELGGTTPGQAYDVIDVDGSLALGGTLDVQLIYGFQPQTGQAFDLLGFDPASLSGQFDTISLPDLGGGLSWDTSNLYTTGAIGVVPEPATLSLMALGGAALIARRKRN